jgi:16S rRNA (guanine966-N2)-methyltransferase
MSMRIIGGKAKGRTLQFPAKSKERPTSDFLREALFNLLGPLQGKTFLDIFAGSGSVGIEAASRQAKEVILIENNKTIASVAQKNIAVCGLEKECRIMAQDFMKAISDLSKKQYQFDIVFADPPYSKGLVGETISSLKKNLICSNESVLVIQHSTREDFRSFLNDQVILQDQRIYGDNSLTFITMEHS